MQKERVMQIGVIGVGVVGAAVLKAFSSVLPSFGYDVKDDGDCWKRILNSDVAFICVPSPTIDNKQDLSILESVIARLQKDNYKGVACIKCTVLPGTCEKLRVKSGLRIVHNPEFLTAAKPYEDFMGQQSVIISGPSFSDLIDVKEAYNLLLPKAVVNIYYNFEITEIAKYMRNVYLAVKVTYANEIAELCERSRIVYSQVIHAMLSQGGIEPGHFSVPGPDGKIGFGGACFPKDSQALNTFLLENGLANEVVSASISGNERRRQFDNHCREIGTETTTM